MPVPRDDAGFGAVTPLEDDASPDFDEALKGGLNEDIADLEEDAVLDEGNDPGIDVV